MFRFTIRDVLWLTVVVALALCSSRERSALQQRTAKLESDSTALQKDRAALESERRAFMAFIYSVRDNAFDSGYRRGTENARIVRVPSSQKEAEPGVYFLGPETSLFPKYRLAPKLSEPNP